MLGKGSSAVNTVTQTVTELYFLSFSEVRLANSAKGRPNLIAADQPIEAIEHMEMIIIPEQVKTSQPCFVLQVKGNSMIEGLF